MNLSTRACLVLIAFSFIIPSVIAQPGSLSASFGVGGKLTDPSRQTFEKAIASQGKKIVIGSQGFYQGFQTFLVDRLLPDGRKDSSFGTGGTAFILFSGDNNPGNITSGINAISLLPDGKIVAVGHAENGGKNIAIARFLPDGEPDASFGKNGASLSGFGIDETPVNMAVQPDGKLVVCGTSTPDFTPGNNHFFVARYMPDGSVDNGFGNKGIVVSNYTGSANAVVIKADGDIVAGGYSTGVDGISFHIECYTANGSYNNNFGNGGIADNRINGGFLNFINDIAVQADGKLVAAGRTNGSGVQTFTLARYNSNGSFDNSFGTNGIVLTSFAGATGEAEKIMLPAKGDHILVSGNRNSNNGGDFVIASYTLSGATDSAFGGAGIVTTDFGGSDFNSSAALSDDGSITALGSNTGQYPFAVRALAKYNDYPASVSLFVKIKRWLQNHILTWNGLPAADNIAYYKVEQSANCKNGFTEIKSISGASDAKEYSVTNSRLLAGANYYRIKAIGADGSVKYSETVSLTNTISSLSVYPNPAKDVIVIRGLKADVTSHISIANDGGKVMMRAVSSKNAQYRMVVSDLQKGSYHLVITTPDGSVETKMFVKE